MAIFYILGFFSALISVLLIFVVVIQNSKGGGLSSAFGGSTAATQILGARRSNEFIERFTWYLAGGLALVAFLANVLTFDVQRDDSIQVGKTFEGKVVTQPVAPDLNNLPTTPQTPTTPSEGAAKPEGGN